ncbi:DUF397 domain-containing protein [Streptomyces sp. JW3]|uniref:DUF397 domain-containing protein n=1 Tax=Streptomyces sp. JW3 TaxID=3456955 RepID=UPI003FA43D19
MSQQSGISPSTPEAQWRKSSYSGGQGDCVEVADNFPALAPVRDSKWPGGPALVFANEAWAAFVGHVRQ